MNLLEFFAFLALLLGEFWPWAALIAAVVGAYVYGGQRLAILVAALGTVAGTYLKGRRDESAKAAEAARKIREKREKAYAEIDARRSTADDVAERLRDRSF